MSTNSGPAASDAVTTAHVDASNDVRVVAAADPSTPAPVTPALANKKASDPTLKQTASAEGSVPTPDADDGHTQSRCNKCTLL